MASVDVALKERQENPIRVALVGAGVTGRMISLQLLTPVAGIRLAAVANRTVARAEQAFKEAGITKIVGAKTQDELENAIEDGQYAVTGDATLVCEASNVDVVVEVTGTVEFAAQVVLRAIRNRKHVVLVNAELDSTLGPILKAHAVRAGVVLTNTDGDEPGVAMTLFRYLRAIGLRPVAAGNLKGMLDRYRTPETQREFADKHSQDPAKVTSFADGTKLSMEATILANATGFMVGVRGMYGPRCAHVNEMSSLLPAEQMLTSGLVDYALGAAPHTGAFVIAHEGNPRKRKELVYYKMGDGPFYVFYTPYHLAHIQVCSTIGRAALFLDPTVTPLGRPVCQVAAVAKRDIEAGEVLDGVGGFATYGVIENSDVFRKDALLPMGLAEGCNTLRAIRKDEPILMTDVEVPPGRLCDQLWREQNSRFFG